MAANIIERHGQVTEWRVTESGYREVERNERSCRDKRPLAMHPTQHRILLTSRQPQSSKRTRQNGKEIPGVLKAEKFIMSNMEVSDVKERWETPDAYSAKCNLHSVPGGAERGTASGVPDPGVQEKIYTTMWAGIAQSV
jgi:hypothetical protein